MGWSAAMSDSAVLSVRGLSVGFNGMTNVVGRLTPEVAEKLHAALSAASAPPK